MSDPTAQRAIDEGTALAVLDPHVETVRAAARAAGGPDGGAWLVGGVVRDALRGRPIMDIDVAVSDDPAAVARAYARATGGSPFPLSDRFGCWRVTAADNGPQLDVCSVHDGDLLTDLRGRDFTVNALAVSVGERRIVDPVGGLEDLREGRIRAVTDASFTDDPLRLLRLARIGQSFDLEPDDWTLSLARASAHRAAEPAGERIFTELAALLECGEARRGIRRLDATGAADVLLPELAACKDMRQGRFHHLDVYEHTLAVLDNAEDIAANPDFHLMGDDAPAIGRAPLTGERLRLALFSALCHDLGKPISRSEDADENVRFIGHERTGDDIAEQLCQRWSTSAVFRRGLRQLVRTHLHLGFLLHGAQDAKALYGFARATDPHGPEAVVLSLADRLATAGAPDRRRWVRRHHAMAKRCWAWTWTEIVEGRQVPLLDGLAIADAAGIQPGPALKGLVAALAEAQATGMVSDAAEARELIATLAQESEPHT